jgi:hypothetical protein
MTFNVGSPLESQRRDIHNETLERKEQIVNLEKVSKHRLAEVINKIKTSNEANAQLLEQLRKQNLQTFTNADNSADLDPLQELTTLMQFVIDLKKAESLDAIRQQTKEFQEETKKTEDEAAAVKTDAKSIEEITEQIQQVLSQTQANIQHRKENKSRLAMISSKV